MPTLEREYTLPKLQNIDDIADKVYRNERLSFEDGLRLFHHHNLPELGMLANHVRERLHPETNHLVTYIVGRNINYTNVCWVRCKFCAFYRVPGHEEGYTLSRNPPHRIQVRRTRYTVSTRRTSCTAPRRPAGSAAS